MSINDKQNKSFSKIHSSKHTTSGTVVSRNGQLRGLFIVQGSAAGTVNLREGGSAGNIIASFDTTADSTIADITVPGSGIEFSTDLYIELTNITSATVFYN